MAKHKWEPLKLFLQIIILRFQFFWWDSVALLSLSFSLTSAGLSWFAALYVLFSWQWHFLEGSYIEPEGHSYFVLFGCLISFSTVISNLLCKLEIWNLICISDIFYLNFCGHSLGTCVKFFLLCMHWTSALSYAFYFLTIWRHQVSCQQ